MNNATVLDCLLSSQPYKTEALLRREDAVNRVTNKRMAEQQEALLKEQKEGSYTYAVLENSIRELKDDKAAQTTLEQQLQNWRDGHESYARVGVRARRHG